MVFSRAASLGPISGHRAAYRPRWSTATAGGHAACCQYFAPDRVEVRNRGRPRKEKGSRCLK